MRTLFAFALLLLSIDAHAERAIGVNTHQASGDSIEIIKDMGATWVRVSQPWAEIEKQPNVYDFAFTEATLTDLKSRGMKVLFILGYAPPQWSSNGKQNGVPNKDAWVRYVDAITRKLGDKVDVWEIWNEPNLSVFWTGNMWQYVDVVLKPASAVIRRNAPNTLIAAPGITHILESWPGLWMTNLKWSGALGTFDIVSYHAYSRSSVQDFKKMLTESSFFKPSVRKVIEDAGLAGKPFWLTEYGCDQNETGSEERNATCLYEMTKVLKELPWVSGWFTYALNDGGWALLRPNGTPKPSVDALKTLYSQ